MSLIPQKEKIEERKTLVLEFMLQTGRPVSWGEIRKGLGFNDFVITRILERLIDEGKIMKLKEEKKYQLLDVNDIQTSYRVRKAKMKFLRKRPELTLKDLIDYNNRFMITKREKQLSLLDTISALLDINDALFFRPNTVSIKIRLEKEIVMNAEKMTENFIKTIGEYHKKKQKL